MNSRPAHPIVPGSVPSPLAGPGASQTVGADFSPVSASASPIGAVRDGLGVASPNVQSGVLGPTGGAGAPNASTLPQVTCEECEGSGSIWFIAIDQRDYELGHCDTCDGTGLVDPVCGTCQGPLTATGWCPDCDDFGLTDFIVTVAPDGTAYLSEGKAA